MTAIDDTRSDLTAAGGQLALARSSAISDPGLAAAIDGPVQVAAAGVADALAAVSAYEASLTAPLVAGLSVVDMAPRGGVKNGVCRVAWRDLQPAASGSAIVRPNRIDAAIASGVPFRVRLDFGLASPSWAFTLAGAIDMYDRQDAHRFKVPRWWIPELQGAQAEFLAALAALYDGAVPAIFAASNMTGYAEPFIRQVGDAQTRANLLAAGYTAAADQASYLAMLDMFSVWKRTRVALSFNPWQRVTPGGAAAADTYGFAVAMLQEFRRRYPSGIAQNNSIRTPPLPGLYPQLYAALKASPPLAFQTATMPRVGDLAATLEWAIGEGAHLVELDPGWRLTAAQVADYDARLRANA